LRHLHSKIECHKLYYGFQSLKCCSNSKTCEPSLIIPQTRDINQKVHLGKSDTSSIRKTVIKIFICWCRDRTFPCLTTNHVEISFSDDVVLEKMQSEQNANNTGNIYKYSKNLRGPTTINWNVLPAYVQYH
jgi:hypothetical protein